MQDAEEFRRPVNVLAAKRHGRSLGLHCRMSRIYSLRFDSELRACRASVQAFRACVEALGD